MRLGSAVAMMLAAGFALNTAGLARAAGLSCWNQSLPIAAPADISCVQLTRDFLRSMRGVTREQVISSMGATGRPSEDRLHYLSNFGDGKQLGAGEVNFTFDADDRVISIDAIVVQPHQTRTIDFQWDSVGYQCSDFPESRLPCSAR
jgi:hypothetical protein